MKFKGVDSPEIYLIDFHQEDDPTIEFPFSGQRGNFIMSLLGSYGLLGKIRCANYTMQGRSVVEEDILNTSPKLIVSFGSPVLNTYIKSKRKITDLSGQIFTINLRDHTFPCLVMESPTNLINHLDDRDSILQFSKDLYKASQIITGEYKDVLKEKEILSAHSYDEFLEIYKSRFADNTDLAYDIETNARPPMYKGSRIIGFSIANKQSGIYVSIDTLEFHMTQDEEDKIWVFLLNEVFEKKNKLVIHNTMYERPYTLYCKNYEIGIDKADDTLVMARLLRDPKDGAGLKYQAQKYLQYPDWETDLTTYINSFRALVKRIGLGPKKYQLLYQATIDREINLFDIYSTPEYEKLKDLDKEEVSNTIESLRSVLVDLYTADEIDNLGILISQKIKETVERGGVQDSTIPYNWIPDRVLSKYGAVDSLATYDLRDYFFNIMKNESTADVDLFQGYRNWLEHMYVAYIMERNGLYWDDTLSSKDRAFLEDQATKCLRALLQSPLFEPHINQAVGLTFKPLILSDYLPQIPMSQGYTVKYERLDGKYTITKDGSIVKKASLNDIKIEGRFQTRYDEVLKLLFQDKVNSAPGYEELKDLYNPSSAKETEIAMQILVTPDLQLCHRIISLATLATSPEFESVIPTLSPIDQKFLSVAELLVNEEKLKSMYNQDWVTNRKALYHGFINLYNTCAKKIVNKEIKEAIGKNNVFKVESLDDEGIISVYNCLVVTGIDKDDPTTWTEQFKWLINYRLFKKSFKLLSSYIDGSVGRGSVAIVKKSNIESGDHRIERLDGYYDRPAMSDEAYILNTSWGPNTAQTGRWRSSVHTIPAGSQVKKYYTSRFPGGTMLMPDYSTMEVRALAGIARDNGMMELFRSGKDFHTETARKIFRKQDITPAERRFSKAATFALLYGASENTFANNYCKGDLSMAKEIYGGFFSAYPKVKEWIDKRHEEVQKDHRVSLDLANRFIKINPEGEGKGALSAMLRKAQNYPIQATSADLVGCVVYDIQKFFEDNDLKSLLVMYVHDSIEVDVPPFELIKVIKTLKDILIDSPQKRMDLPAKADVALGYSLGHEIEMGDIETNEDDTECIVTLNGYKDEIDETMNNWASVYKTVEMFDENWKDIYVSMGELFIAKKAYTPTLGTHRKKGTCKIKIKYYK